METQTVVIKVCSKLVTLYAALILNRTISNVRVHVSIYVSNSQSRNLLNNKSLSENIFVHVCKYELHFSLSPLSLG